MTLCNVNFYFFDFVFQKEGFLSNLNVDMDLFQNEWYLLRLIAVSD